MFICTGNIKTTLTNSQVSAIYNLNDTKIRIRNLVYQILNKRKCWEHTCKKCWLVVMASCTTIELCLLDVSLLCVHDPSYPSWRVRVWFWQHRVHANASRKSFPSLWKLACDTLSYAGIISIIYVVCTHMPKKHCLVFVCVCSYNILSKHLDAWCFSHCHECSVVLWTAAHTAHCLVFLMQRSMHVYIRVHKCGQTQVYAHIKRFSRWCFIHANKHLYKNFHFIYTLIVIIHYTEGVSHVHTCAPDFFSPYCHAAMQPCAWIFISQLQDSGDT